MVDVVIRAAEGCDPDPFLLWNATWSSADGIADWRLAGSGGLAADAALATAVVLCLFTDKRVPPDHPVAYLTDGDPRGWWGDGVDVRADLDETELGSWLWLLERAPLTFLQQSGARWAEQFARDALAPLIGQNAVSRIDASATVDEIANRLELSVQLYGRDGASAYDRKFELVWKQMGLL
jgi:phage gp46-like protein